MNKLPKHVVSFDVSTTAAVETVVDDPKLVDRPYKSKSWRHFTNTQKGAISGHWEAAPHLERCKCDFDEMCHILEGRVRLTDAEGVAREFDAGDTFVVAAGFNGTWENLTFVRKIFFILS